LVTGTLPEQGFTATAEYLSDRLDPDSFVRIHRSRIINLEAVEAFDRKRMETSQSFM